MCFVFNWEQKATCATYSINWLVFITEMKSVYSAVRTGSLNKTCTVSYNDISNQQDATTFSLINLFKSALHVSGEKLAHPQKHFLNVCTAFGTMHRHCCRPEWNCSVSTVAPVGSSVGALYQKLYIVRKCSWVWANFSPETCRADLKRLINEKAVASCWSLTSSYWWRTVTQTSTPQYRKKRPVTRHTHK